MLDNAISIVMRTAFIGSLLTFLLAGSAFGLAAPDIPADTDHSGMLPMIADDTDQVPDFDFTDFSGKKRKFSEFKGKVVLIDFWATWCGPCKESLPLIDRVNTQLQPCGLRTIAIEIEGAEAKAKQFATALGLKLPLGSDPGTVAERYGITQIPLTVLIDAEGQVRRVFRGVHSAEELTQAIESVGLR